MPAYAKGYYEKSFYVLVPDARGHGKSEGNYIGMGWHERLDILGWIQKIISEDEHAEIVLYGISMGGATVRMASGEKLPKNVKAIIEDCGYTSVWDEFSNQLKRLYNLPSFPIMHFASIVTKVRAGYWLGEASAIKQVTQSATPIMFIHGDKDTFVPFYMLEQIYDVAQCPKEKLAAVGAKHGEALSTLKEKYWAAVLGFISKYMDT